MPRKFLFLLIAYFLLHVIVRTFISNSVEFDEAEQVLFSQQLSFGYNSQPPLYEWVQKIFFTLFGLNVFSLALFKNILFVLFYFFLYKSAQIILKDHLRAGLASLALLITHTYAWQAARQLTHAVLALAISAITLFLFLRVKETKARKYYLPLGVFIALGILSKYTYLVFILALFLAGLTVRDYRSVILDRRMLWSLFIPGFITAPHFAWVASHFQLASLRLGEMQMDTQKAKGLLDFLLCLLAILGPFVVIFLGFFPQVFRRNKLLGLDEQTAKQLLERFFFIAVAIIALEVVVLRIVDFEERWLQVIFFVFPTYLFLRLKNKTISQLRIKIYAGAIAVSAFVLVMMLAAVALWPDIFGYKRLHFPIAELAGEIRKEGFDKGLVLSCDTSLAADLKLIFKDSLVLTHRTPFSSAAGFDKILLIWGDTWWYDVPRELAEILPRYQIKAERTEIVKQALYKHSRKKYYKVYLMVINR